MNNPEIANYIDRTAQLLNLPLQNEHRPGVIQNFTTLSQMSTLVMEFPLPPHIEAAPIFKP